MADILNALILLANFVIIPGLTYGAQLALGALGITIVFSILRFANFAHGEMMSFGAMIALIATYWLQSIGITITPFPTALLALPVAILFTVGVSIFFGRNVFAYYRRKKSSPSVFAIVSVGIMFIISGIVRLAIGPQDRNFSDGARFLVSPREFKELTGLAEGLAIKQTQVITIVTSFIVVAALFWFMQKTLTGKSMRAFSDNEELALLSGIRPERVVAICWIITGTLAAIAGTLYGLEKSYKPFIYMQLLLPMFAAAVVGGVGQPVGAILGGFVVAFSEVTLTYAYKKFLAYLVPQSLEPDTLMQLLATEYKFAISFAILVIILLVRPTGIMRGKTL